MLSEHAVIPESLRESLRGQDSHDRGAPPGESRMVARITFLTIVVLGIWVATVGLFLSLLGVWVGAHGRDLRAEPAPWGYAEAWQPETNEVEAGRSPLGQRLHLPPVEILPEFPLTLLEDRARWVPDPCEVVEVPSKEGGDGQ